MQFYDDVEGWILMKCPICDSNISTGFHACAKCGHSISYGGNTEFYKKAAYSKLTLKDVFSDVFKPHSKKDGEKVFMAGTSLTTPSEKEMLSEWRKPWLFARIGVIGLVFIALLFVLMLSGAGNYAVVPLVFVGATIIPLAVLLFLWEMNIPRNIPIYGVLIMLFIGGAISLIITWFLGSIVGSVPAYWAPLSEEPAKLLALCLFLHSSQNKYILNGLLIGAAIGTGFAAIETMGYTLGEAYNINLLLKRGLLSPGGHVAWAAMYGGALAMVKGSQNLELKHFFEPDFLKFFGLAFLLHFLWNSDIPMLSIPLFVDLKFIILITVAWLAIINLLNKGIQQVLTISTPHSIPAKPISYDNKCLLSVTPSTLIGISGVYKDCSFPLSSGKLVIGRDSHKSNIVYAASTPGISSVHCELSNDGGKNVLVDMGSSYGTFLANGTRLVPNTPCVLKSGDRFYLANHDNIFEVR